MDDAGTAPAAETPPRAPRHQGRGALPRAEAVRGSLELALSMLQLKDMAGAKTMLQALIAAHGGRVTGDHTTGQPVPPPRRTRRGRRGRAAARPPDPATEPHESGVAHGELVHEATDRAAPCKPAPGAPPSSAALAAVTPPPAEEPPPPIATGVHGARDERGMSSEDETTSGPPLRGMTSVERAALTTLEASAWASGGSDGRGPRPRACSPPSSSTTDDDVARPTKLQALNDD